MLYAVFAALAALSFGFFLLRWQLLLSALLIFLPLSGALVLWSQQDTIFILAKDLLYLFPLYIAVFLLRPQILQGVPIPPWLTLTIIVLALVVLLQMMNPGVVNISMALIGAKVWLSYIPLAYIVAASLRTEEDIVRLLRVICVIAPVPCIVGLTQYSLSESIGYRETMTSFYGEAAAGATQNFTQFDMGGIIRRIPSTFTNSASYFVFTLGSMTAALALQALDRSRGWRTMARLLVVLLIVAGMLSGMRAAFVFPPVLLLFYAMVSGRSVGALGGTVLIFLLAFAFLYITGFDTDRLAEGVGEHAEGYQNADFSWSQFSYALDSAPFGFGTGTSTVSARYATEGLTLAEKASLGGYEVQFAKTVHELGIFGLIPFLILMGGLVARSLFGTLRMRDLRLRKAHAAFGAFVVVIFLYFFKAWVIDVDPGNVYFWIFVGLLYRVARLETQASARQSPQALLNVRQAPGRRRASPARPAFPVSRREHLPTRQ